MSQQPREPSEPAEIRPDRATEPRGDTSPMFDFLFSQLRPPAPGEPVSQPRLMPVASRAWSFLLRYCRDRNKREPPGTSPYYCDRCKP
jgi:hypothetical protein